MSADNRYAAWAARWRVPLGFILGAAYLVFSQPSPRLLLAGSVVGLAGLLLRALAAGCLDKNQNLATGGPYAHTRNPLYLGSFIIGTGFAMAGGSWILGLAMVSLFVLVYLPVMRREAAFLARQFGPPYAGYARAVPFFLPRLQPADTGGKRFRWATYRQNREYQAALGFVTGVVFLYVKMTLR